ncbi:acyl-CoA desaturase [Chitinimonas lacunae]|uniref:Acyl-CoA desaturase n=1 Tax=Chitinimonas lacunae TaxID=1963018 RepID=A0ABV8MWQ5_9NEIS
MNGTELNLPPLAYGPDTAVEPAPVKTGRTVRNARLRTVQHIHTVVMSGAGFLGLISAVLLAVLVQPVSGLALAIFLVSFLLVGMGLTIGYHRLFTHRSYKAGTALRMTLAALGCMAGQGPVVFWVALHRMHHEFSDRAGDPHSPNLNGQGRWAQLRGLFHAYIGWTVKHEVPNANFYARDLLTDAPLMWVNRRYYLWVALGLLLPTAAGGLIGGSAYAALEGLLWGGLIRMFALHNVIWWITSFAHVFGSRDFRSRDLSTNNFWLAIPTLGESWHNNHHGFPRAAVLSFRWWQLDLSGLVILSLEKLGLVWEVNRPTPAEQAARRAILPTE